MNGKESTLRQTAHNPETLGVLQWAQYYLDNYATVAEAVDLTAGKYYFESTLAPKVVWIDTLDTGDIAQIARGWNT